MTAEQLYENGRGCIEQGDYEKAIEAFTQAINLDANQARFFYNRGIAYHQKKEYGSALMDLVDAISLDPECKLYRNRRGLVYYDLEKYDLAIADYNGIIGVRSDEAAFYGNRGKAYLKLKHYDKAIMDYKAAMWHNPDDPEICNLAIAAYSKAIEIQPDEAAAFYYNSRGKIYARLKQYDKAIADYETALAITKDDKLRKICTGHIEEARRQRG